MKERKRISTDGEPISWASPFAALKHVGLPPTPAIQLEGTPRNTVPLALKKNRGRVDIIRHPNLSLLNGALQLHAGLRECG